MEIKLEWNSSHSDCGQAGCSGLYEDILIVTTDQGHELKYVRSVHTGGYGPDLSDPMVVLPMVLRDLGFNVTEINGLSNAFS